MFHTCVSFAAAAGFQADFFAIPITSHTIGPVLQMIIQALELPKFN
jgi:hypothetical protein